MAGTSENAVVDTSAPLSEVMLAMDVVDTLRHEQALIEQELGEDERERRLTLRIRDIYESQGIEVSDEVIRKGVAALHEDRFTYDPPERTLAVRLAEVYVDRVKWTLGAGAVVLVAAMIWAGFTIPAHIERRSLVAGFRDRLEVVRSEATTLTSRATQLGVEVDGARRDDDLPTAAAIVAAARRQLEVARQQVTALESELTPGPDPESYPGDRVRLDGVLEDYRTRLDAVTTGLGSVAGQLRALEQLRGLRAELLRLDDALRKAPDGDGLRAELAPIRDAAARAIDAGDTAAATERFRVLRGRLAAHVEAVQQRVSAVNELTRLEQRLEGIPIEADVKPEVEELRVAARAALDAAEVELARRDLARLRNLAEILEQSYELRIVARQGEQSGVWRHPDGRRDKRNYYVIVEAIGEDGRALRLWITNEEDQTTREVRKFGVRVPEAVYESVKADKLDNGLVDDALFGTKRRGAKAVEYRFEVTGGTITSW